MIHFVWAVSLTIAYFAIDCPIKWGTSVIKFPLVRAWEFSQYTEAPGMPQLEVALRVRRYVTSPTLQCTASGFSFEGNTLKLSVPATKLLLYGGFTTLYVLIYFHQIVLTPKPFVTSVAESSFYSKSRVKAALLWIQRSRDRILVVT